MIFIYKFLSGGLIFATLCAFSSTAAAERNEELIDVKEAAFYGMQDGVDIFNVRAEQGAEVRIKLFPGSLDRASINDWQAGKNIMIAYSPSRGGGIREKDGRFRKATFLSGGPIEMLQAECLEEAMSTMGISGCYEQSAERWETEIKVMLKYAEEAMPADSAEAFRRVHSSWLEYKSDVFAAMRTTEGARMGGTITIIEHAALASGMRKRLTLNLQRFLY